MKVKRGDQVTKKGHQPTHRVINYFQSNGSSKPLKCSIHNLKHKNNVGGKKTVTFQANPCKIAPLKCDKFHLNYEKNPGYYLNKKEGVSKLSFQGCQNLDFMHHSQSPNSELG